MNDDASHLGLLEDDSIVLDTSALEIAALDHPDIDLQPYAEILSDLTERLVVRGTEARTAAERAEALGDVIAGEFGFTGDRQTYEDPDNADLIRVIDRRRGLPVSLAILYVAAARRLGWDADVLNTPGHVLVRVDSPTEPVLIDPFADGATVDATQLAALLTRMIGPGIAPTAEHLTAMPSRAVLVRLMMNQAARAESSGQGSRALALYRRMTDVAPSNSHLWWERARLELIDGDLPAVRSSLSAMLEVTREPGLRAHIFAALDAISGASS